MASIVETCNLALSHIRAQSINSLIESSIPAQQCKLHYAILRDQMLKDTKPQFARRIDALAVRFDEVFNWAYAYQYPSDCLDIVRLIPNFEEVEQGNAYIYSPYRDPDLRQPNLHLAVEYQVQNIGGDRVIASNTTEARIEYIVRVEDPNLYGPQFILAQSHLMASALAIPLVGGEQGLTMQARNLQIYQQYVDATVASNYNEQYTDVPDSEFITVR